MCDFPGCNEHALANGMCIGHQMYADKPLIKSKPAGAKKAGTENFALRQMQKQIDYKKNIFLRSHKVCEINSPVCSVAATTIRHSVVNGKHDLLNTDLWQASSDDCEHYINVNPNTCINERH